MLKQFLNDDSGATAIEYGLIAALISLAMITGAKAMGTSINSKFSTISTALSTAGDTSPSE